MTHSVNEKGEVCVNLDDFTELSHSIRFRERIDHLRSTLGCPKEISNFSITMCFKNGERYYLSSLYLWAIPYLTEGFYRGDLDHEVSVYRGKEFFVQNELQRDDTQLLIREVMELRYSLYTSFAMVRESEVCDFVIESYHNERINDPGNLYFRVRDQFEDFILKFIVEMDEEIKSTCPGYDTKRIFLEPEYRSKVIKRELGVKDVSLTSREIKCLVLYRQGKQTKEIAVILNISEEAVVSRGKAARKKMGCKNMTHCISRAIDLGILS